MKSKKLAKSKENQDTNDMTGYGFWDKKCPDCGRRYGWRGKENDDPGCPQCKKIKQEHSPKAAQAKMTQMKCHMRAQEIFDEHKKRLGATELAFIHAMTKKRKYTVQQVNNVNRMYRKYIGLEVIIRW